MNTDSDLMLINDYHKSDKLIKLIVKLDPKGPLHVTKSDENEENKDKVAVNPKNVCWHTKETCKQL